MSDQIEVRLSNASVPIRLIVGGMVAWMLWMTANIMGIREEIAGLKPRTAAHASDNHAPRVPMP